MCVWVCVTAIRKTETGGAGGNELRAKRKWFAYYGEFALLAKLK